MPRYYQVRHSKIHGNGVFAARDIPREKEIIYYKGKLITPEEADDGEDDTGHTFLFTLNEKWVIEAAIDGNDARWINHSCNPNCEALLIEDENGNKKKDQIVIQAMRKIRKGEELTYDYNIYSEERFTSKLKKMWQCKCGSKKCRGVIIKKGKPPEDDEE